MNNDENERINWQVFCLRFFFGAIFGALIGVYGWAHLADGTSWFLGAICIGIGALIAGLCAGYYGEEFWESFRDNNWWKF